MPSVAEQYRAKADACERLAKEMSYSPAKTELLEMAREWRELAEREAQQGR